MINREQIVVVINHGLGDVVMSFRILFLIGRKYQICAIVQSHEIARMLQDLGLVNECWVMQSRKKRPLKFIFSVTRIILRLCKRGKIKLLVLHGRAEPWRLLSQLSIVEVISPLVDYYTASTKTRHKTEYWLDVLPLIGIAPNKSSKDENETFSKTFARTAEDAGACIIFPGAGQRFKTMSTDLIVKLSNWLVTEKNKRIKIVGGLGDRDTIDCIRLLMAPDENIDFLIKDFEIREIFELAGSSEMCIGADCGLMHVAAATGTRSIVTVGPTNDKWTAPIGSRVKVVRDTSYTCSPCQGNYFYSCGGDVPCMKSEKLLQSLMQEIENGG